MIENQDGLFFRFKESGEIEPKTVRSVVREAETGVYRYSGSPFEPKVGDLVTDSLGESGAITIYRIDRGPDRYNRFFLIEHQRI